MLRCVLLAAALACALPAAAQVQRNFPATALRGTLAITQPPEVLLNGAPARPAPGARRRGPPHHRGGGGGRVGRRVGGDYTVDIAGLVIDVWLLTPQEAARQPWPTTAAQAAAWRFDPMAQTWSRP